MEAARHPLPPSALPPPLGSETTLPQGQSLVGSLLAPAPARGPPTSTISVPWWSRRVLLGVLCFLIQWCQTLISPQKRSVTPRDPSATALQERSLPGCAHPALPAAPDRTSLAEGEGVGE